MQGLSIRRPRNNNIINVKKNNISLNNSNYGENVWDVNISNFKPPIGNVPEYGRGSTTWADKPITLLSPVEVPKKASPRYTNSPVNMPSPIEKPSNASTWSLNSSFYEPPTQKRKLSRRANRRAGRRSNRKAAATRRNTRK